MKKLIFAAIAVIAMLAGTQSVFAEQFTAPEISVSNNDCCVLDVPGDAAAEICDYQAPWQVPEVNEVSAVMTSQSDTFLFTPCNLEFDVPNITSVSVSVSLSNYTKKLQYYIYGDPSNGDPTETIGYGEITSASGFTRYFGSLQSMKKITISITTPSLSSGGGSVSYWSIFSIKTQ